MIYVDESSEECVEEGKKIGASFAFSLSLSDLRAQDREKYNLWPFSSGSLFFTILGNSSRSFAVLKLATSFLTHVFARDANGKSIFVATVSANNRV